RVRLENTGDAFALDDVAWIVPGVARKARVLVIGPENPVLRKFLDSPSTRKMAEVTRYDRDKLTDKAAYLDPVRDGKYDLVIFDRCGPASEDEMPRGNTFFIGHPPPSFQQKVKPVKNPRITGWL